MSLPHPSPEQLRRFGLGQLSGASLDDIAAHVQDCDECCRYLSSLPDDGLIVRARDANAFIAPQVVSTPEPKRALLLPIPEALRNHPRYEILECIGKGGMGLVFKARHRHLGRLVAIKVINARFLEDERAVERFRREVRAAGRLNHPNIVSSLDADEAGGMHFLVMEYVAGNSLDAVVALQGPLPVDVSCSYIRQAALGLHYAHEQGMVHRDIKPHNLMLTSEGSIKLLDLGLARFASHWNEADSFSGSSLTSLDAIIGTPDYLAPEQAMNPPRIDARADIYGLGCTLFYLLTGRPPFPGGTGMEKVMRHCQDARPDVRGMRPDVPVSLANHLAAMMARDPDERFPNAAEVAHALQPFCASDSARAAGEQDQDSVTLVGGAVGPNGRRRTGRTFSSRWLAVTVALVLLGVLGAFLVLRTDNTGTLPAQLPSKKVLLVLPRQGLWHADYQNVRKSLERANIQVLVASSRPGPCELHDDPGNVGAPVHTDLVLDGNVRAEDFDALICVGASSEEYAARTETGRHLRLLAENMLATRGKYVAAIGLGQRTLGQLGLLRGRLVAGCRFLPFPELREQYQAKDATWQPVEVHGQVVTCLHADHGEELGQVLAQLLTEAPK